MTDNQELLMRLQMEADEVVGELLYIAATAEDADEKIAALQAIMLSLGETTSLSLEQAKAALVALTRDLGIFAGTTEFPITKAFQELKQHATVFDQMKTTNAVAETNKLTDATRAYVKEIKEVAAKTGASFRTAAQGIKNSKLDTNVRALNDALSQTEREAKALQSVIATFKGISAATNNAKSAVGGLRGAFNNLGSVAKTVFGFTLANIATRALRAVTQYMKEAVVAGEEFARGLFRMSVGIRALQSSGMDVTIGEFTNKITELRQQWGTFTQKELVDSVGYMTLLTREVGLTKDQMFDLMEASAALSVLLGKDMNETLRQVSLAISSGYAEALQRAGLNVNKVEIANKALEMGIDKTFMAMTGEERALVTLTLVLEQTAKVTEDAAKWQDTLAGSIEVSKVAFGDLKNEMGEDFLPIWALILKAGVAVINVFTGIRDAAREVLAGLLQTLLYPIVGVTIAATMMWKNLSGKGEFGLADFNAAMEEAAESIRKNMREVVNLDLDTPFSDLGISGAKAFSKGFTDELSNFMLNPDVIDAFEELEEIIADINEDITDEMEGFYQSLLIKQRKFALRFEAMMREHAAAREKLVRSTNEKIESENIKYQQKVSDAHRDHLQDQADAELDYRRRELDAEQDYQDEIRRMRDQLLFDLEEAVRQRDAAQIRRLLRQANFRKDQLGIDREREREENKARLERELADNKLKLKRELEDIRRAHAIRLREIRIDGKRRLAELIRTQQARMQALMDQERLERELAEEKHRRELEDIRAAGEKKVQLWTETFLAMFGITVDATNQIYKYLNGAFGPGGSIEGLFQYLTSMVAQMVLQFQKLAGSMKSLPKSDGISKGGGLKPPVDATPWAEGGTLIANKPTLAVFGDAGPERVDFTPIGRQGANVGKVFGGALPSGGDGQKLALEILLSPDLEARVIESSLGELSDILVSVERAV